MTIRAYHVQSVVTALLALSVLYSLVLESLAVAGAKPFHYRRGFYGVESLATGLMPPPYYPIISILVYIGLIFIGIFAVIATMIDVDEKEERKSFESFSIPYLVLLVISINLYTGVLFAEDNLNASLGFIFSLLLLISNCLALSYASYNLYLYGKILYQNSIEEFFWSIGVVNATAIYLTWTLVHFINSFAVLLVHQGTSDMTKVCTGVLIILLIVIVFWFIVENTFLISIFNTIGSHYLVLVWYFATLYPKQVQTSPNHLKVLMITDLVLAVVAFLLRLALLYRNNRGNKMYKRASTSVAASQDVVVL